MFPPVMLSPTAVENSLMVPQKVKIELPYDPVTPLLVILKRSENKYSNKYKYKHVNSSIIIIKRRKEPRCPPTYE